MELKFRERLGNWKNDFPNCAVVIDYGNCYSKWKN